MDYASIAIAAITGVISAATTIAVIRTELKYLRRDVDKHDTRIDTIERILPCNFGAKS